MHTKRAPNKRTRKKQQQNIYRECYNQRPHSSFDTKNTDAQANGRQSDQPPTPLPPRSEERRWQREKEQNLIIR